MGEKSFIKRTLEAGIVAGTMATAGGSASAVQLEHPKPNFDALYVKTIREHDEYFRGTLDFHEYSPANTEKVLMLSDSIDKHNNDYENAFGLAFKGGSPHLESHGSSVRLPPQKKFRDIREHLWRGLTHIFPDLPPSYSDESYYGTMVSLPERLASLGIYSDVAVYAVNNHNGIYDIFVRYDQLFPIQKRTEEPVVYFGRSVTAPICYLGEPLNKRLRNTKTIEAYSAFGSIFVFPDCENLNIRDWNYGQKNLPDILMNTERRFGGTIPGIEPYRTEYVINRSINGLLAHAEMPSRSEFVRTIVDHEKGHVLDAHDASYQNHFMRTDDEIMHPEGNPFYLKKGAHDETDGLLSALRYGDKKVSLFYLLTRLMSVFQRNTPAHHYGAWWIFHELTPIIARNPSAFGLTLDPQSPYTPDEQILIGLPDILRTKPAELDKAWEDIWHIHRTKLDEDIVEQRMRESIQAEATHGTPPEPEKSKKGKKEGGSLIATLVAGTGGIAILLATLQARRLRERMKKEFQERQRAIKSVSDVLGGMRDGKHILEGLQLTVPEKGLDRRRRDSAYEELIKLAEKSPRAKKIISHIKALIGTE